MLSVRRLLAYWIDFILLASILVALQVSINYWTSGFPFQYFTEGYEIELWVLATMSLPVWLYFILCEWSLQQTIGKLLFKLRVADDSGGAISFLQSLTRTAVKLLPWELTHLIVLIPEPWWNVEESANPYLIYIPNAAILLYVVVLFVNKGVKGIHDVMAGTHIRDTKRK